MLNLNHKKLDVYKKSVELEILNKNYITDLDELMNHNFALLSKLISS